MTFPLTGNEHIKTAVTNAIETNRLPHAVIIEGDPGQGKHTLSRFITDAAVCSGDDKPCLKCRSCLLAKAGTHPDINIIAPEDKKKNISVGQIRELITKAYIKPHIADRLVFVIDGADTMNPQAQNALLKVLEEPPGDIVFILIAESKSALLETVISRCITFTLTSPERTAAAEYIKNVTGRGADEINASLDDAKGNIGRALDSLADKEDSACEAAAKEFLRLVFSGSEFDMLKLLSQFEKDRTAAGKFYKLLKLHTAALLRQNSGDSIKARALCELYKDLTGFEKSLETNINLPLLFSATVCRAAKTKI